MVNIDEIERLIGGTAYDSSGHKVGKIGMVYLDDQTNEPDWVTVNTGFLGSNESFVPLEGAVVDGDSLRLAYTADQIKDAPTVDADAHLDVAHEDELYQHYGRPAHPATAPQHHTHATNQETTTQEMSEEQAMSDQGSRDDDDSGVVHGTARGEEIAGGIIDVEKSSAGDSDDADGGEQVDLRDAEETADHRRD